MLLSQSILRDINFLASLKEDNYDLRVKILRTTKILASNEFLGLGAVDDNRTTWDHIARLLKLDASNKVEEAIEKRELLWDKYARLPFSTMFIENDDVGIYVEQIDERTFSFQSIFRWKKRGIADPVPRFVRRDDNGRLVLCLLRQNANTHYVKMDRVMKSLTEITYVEPGLVPSDVENAIELITLLRFMCLMEILLFLNLKNVRLHEVTPTKKEKEKIPKPLQAFHTYRVLDVYRERTGYVSLEDALSHLNSVVKEERKAHLVRGHFKDTRHGLFWWNAHARNIKNADTLGIVEKGYRIISS